MRSGVIAQKVGMTRIFTDNGEHVPVTVLKLENLQVLSHRTVEKNGYTAIQVGGGTRKVSRLFFCHSAMMVSLVMRSPVWLAV